MAGGDDDYKPSSFDGYVVTTVNPGGILLLSTVLVCLVFFLVCYFIMPGKFWKKRQSGVTDDDVASNMYQIMDDGMIELTGRNRKTAPSSLAERVRANEKRASEQRANEENDFEAHDGRSKRVWEETRQITKLGTP